MDPLVVKALTMLGFAIPVVGYLVFIQHYQVNAVLGDQWDDVPVIRQSYHHFFDWSSLWSPHNGNRILFPNLIVVTLAHTVHFNIDIEEYLGALMLFGATALFIWSHKRRSPSTPLLFYCPVAFLTLSFAQYSNTLWGFQIGWYVVLLSLALTLVLLDRPSLTWPIVLAAGLAAVVGSYSLLQGFLIWPVGIVLLYQRRRPRWTYVSWIAAAALTAGLYFYNFSNGGSASSPRNALDHPFVAVKFFIYALGDIVGVQTKYGAPGNAAVMFFGVVVLVLAVLVLIKWGFRRDEQSAVPIGIALIVFGLLFDALITEGRVVFGLWGAAQSRYTTNDVLVLAGIYMTSLSGFPARVRTEDAAESPGDRRGPPVAVAWVRDHVERINRGVIRRIAVAAIVVQVVFSVHFGLEGARGVHQEYLLTASVTRNINHESDAAVEFGLGLFSPFTAPWLREQAEFLREHHLSLFN